MTGITAAALRRMRRMLCHTIDSAKVSFPPQASPNLKARRYVME
jgi:hypothetical protein